MNYEVLWMKRKLKFKNLIILVLSIVFLIGFVRQEKTISRIEEEKKAQEVKLEELKQDNARLQEQNDKIQTGEYVEQLAREKLNMIKSGEWSTVNKKSDSDSENWGY